MAEESNLVTSFVTALAPGTLEAVCIKYTMYDGTFRLSYWDERWSRSLYKCTECYCRLHYYGSELQRVSDDPTLRIGLPPRHPIQTMTSERPDLTQNDYWTAQEEFWVEEFRFIDQGDSGRLECTFADEGSRIDVLPGDLMMNLYGFLKLRHCLLSDMSFAGGALG